MPKIARLLAVFFFAFACTPVAPQAWHPWLAPGAEPGFQFQFGATGLPAWVTSSAAYQNGASMITDWTQPNGDGTFGQTYLRSSNSVVKASTVWTRTGTGGTAFDASGNVATFTGTALRATNAGLTTEEARTNLFLNTAAPVTQTITVVNGSTYAVSCQGTGSLALTGAIVGTASCGHPGTPKVAATTTTSLVVTPSGTVTFPQVELGPFPTTPIPTAGSAVTRAQDGIVAVGSPPNWLSQSVGTMMESYILEGVPGSGNKVKIADINDNTANNRSFLSGDQATGQPATSLTGATVSQFTISATVGTPIGVLHKIAGSYSTTDGGFAVDGVASTRSTGTYAVGSYLTYSLGVENGGSFASMVTPMSAFFPTDLSNTALQAVTQ